MLKRTFLGSCAKLGIFRGTCTMGSQLRALSTSTVVALYRALLIFDYFTQSLYIFAANTTRPCGSTLITREAKETHHGRPTPSFSGKRCPLQAPIKKNLSPFSYVCVRVAVANYRVNSSSARHANAADLHAMHIVSVSK